MTDTTKNKLITFIFIFFTFIGASTSIELLLSFFRESTSFDYSKYIIALIYSIIHILAGIKTPRW